MKRSVVLVVVAALGLVLSFQVLALVSRDRRAAGSPLAAEPTSGQRAPEAPLAHVASVVSGADLEQLRRRELLLPVAGVKPAQLRDTFAESRGSHVHEALDIIAPRGTRVLAVDEGRVAKLFKSVRGGLTVYHFDPTETFCYYYAHLDAYAPGLSEGDLLRRGDLVGFVGTTGNAPKDTPHLHFTVFKLGPERRWWEGAAINPFPLWVFSS